MFKGQPFDKKILEELIEEVDEDSKYFWTHSIQFLISAYLWLKISHSYRLSIS